MGNVITIDTRNLKHVSKPVNFTLQLDELDSSKSAIENSQNGWCFGIRKLVLRNTEFSKYTDTIHVKCNCIYDQDERMGVFNFPFDPSTKSSFLLFEPRKTAYFKCHGMPTKLNIVLEDQDFQPLSLSEHASVYIEIEFQVSLV